jgi:hypothetical protein
MTSKECEIQLKKLFAAFSRNLNPGILESWHEELERFDEIHLINAVRKLKTSERLPNLGEVYRLCRNSDKDAQYRAEAQARHDKAKRQEPTRYGMISQDIIRRVNLGKISFDKAMEYQSILTKRYEVKVEVPISSDRDTRKEMFDSYKKFRWREDLKKLRGLVQVSENRFEVRK